MLDQLSGKLEVAKAEKQKIKVEIQKIFNSKRTTIEFIGPKT